MGWFKRLRRKLRNYTSGGDYPGGHGGSPDGGRTSRNATAQGEALAHRPDRFGAGSG